jgi:hypothetical protein
MKTHCTGAASLAANARWIWTYYKRGQTKHDIGEIYCTQRELLMFKFYLRNLNVRH